MIIITDERGNFSNIKKQQQAEEVEGLCLRFQLWDYERHLQTNQCDLVILERMPVQLSPYLRHF